MKKISLLICLLLLLAGCGTKTDNGKITVAVSIPPQKTFVERICGDKVNIVTTIPAGASAESYEMSAKEITAFNRSDIYFSIGVPAEENGILPHLSQNTRSVDLAKTVRESYADIKIGDSRDPHIWLSPKRAIVMVKEIAKEMGLLDSENASFYSENAKAYVTELETLDLELTQCFKDKKLKVFYISHPSYGYFAEDYGLKMIEIEKHGHEATAKELAELSNDAQKSGVKVIFCQEETSKKQAELLAGEIGGRVEILKPLSPDYIKELKRTANLLSEATR